MTINSFSNELRENYKWKFSVLAIRPIWTRKNLIILFTLIYWVQNSHSFIKVTLFHPTPWIRTLLWMNYTIRNILYVFIVIRIDAKTTSSCLKYKSRRLLIKLSLNDSLMFELTPCKYSLFLFFLCILKNYWHLNSIFMRIKQFRRKTPIKYFCGKIRWKRCAYLF